MGRLSRKRKIKAVDPFSKQNASALASYAGEEPGSVGLMRNLHKASSNRGFNLAPVKEDDSIVPTKAARMAKLRSAMNNKRNSKHTKSAKHKSKIEMEKMTPVPGESFKQFARRVKGRVRKVLAESDKSYRKTSDKRKAHLEKRKRQREGKAPITQHGATATNEEGLISTYDDDSDIEETFKKVSQDVVRFGERVEAPPKLSVVPKPPKRARLEALQAMNETPEEEEEEEENEQVNLTESNVTAKNRSVEQVRREYQVAQMEAMRNQVQSAYKAMKQRKSQMRQKKTAGLSL